MCASSVKRVFVCIISCPSFLFPVVSGGHVSDAARTARSLSFENWLRDQGLLEHPVMCAEYDGKPEYCYIRSGVAVPCPFCNVDFKDVASLFTHLAVTRPGAFASSGYRVHRALGVSDGQTQTGLSRSLFSRLHRGDLFGLVTENVFNHSYVGVSSHMDAAGSMEAGGNVEAVGVPDPGVFIDDVMDASGSDTSLPPGQRCRDGEYFTCGVRVSVFVKVGTNGGVFCLVFVDVDGMWLRDSASYNSSPNCSYLGKSSFFWCRCVVFVCFICFVSSSSLLIFPAECEATSGGFSASAASSPMQPSYFASDHRSRLSFKPVNTGFGSGVSNLIWDGDEIAVSSVKSIVPDTSVLSIERQSSATQDAPLDSTNLRVDASDGDHPLVASRVSEVDSFVVLSD